MEPARCSEWMADMSPTIEEVVRRVLEQRARLEKTILDLYRARRAELHVWEDRQLQALQSPDDRERAAQQLRETPPSRLLTTLQLTSTESPAVPTEDHTDGLRPSADPSRYHPLTPPHENSAIRTIDKGKIDDSSTEPQREPALATSIGRDLELESLLAPSWLPMVAPTPPEHHQPFSQSSSENQQTYHTAESAEDSSPLFEPSIMHNSRLAPVLETSDAALLPTTKFELDAAQLSSSTPTRTRHSFAVANQPPTNPQHRRTYSTGTQARAGTSPRGSPVLRSSLRSSSSASLGKNARGPPKHVLFSIDDVVMSPSTSPLALRRPDPFGEGLASRIAGGSTSEDNTAETYEPANQTEFNGSASLLTSQLATSPRTTKSGRSGRATPGLSGIGPDWTGSEKTGPLESESAAAEPMFDFEDEGLDLSGPRILVEDDFENVPSPTTTPSLGRPSSAGRPSLAAKPSLEHNDDDDEDDEDDDDEDDALEMAASLPRAHSRGSLPTHRPANTAAKTTVVRRAETRNRDRDAQSKGSSNHRTSNSHRESPDDDDHSDSGDSDSDSESDSNKESEDGDDGGDGLGISPHAGSLPVEIRWPPGRSR